MKRWPRMIDGFRLIVFDWDGTLADSVEHIVASLDEAGRQLGLPARPPEASRNVIGLGLAEAFRDLHGVRHWPRFSEFRAAYVQCFHRSTTQRVDLFDGTRELLGRLREHGVHLAIATGKGRPGLQRMLQETQLEEAFDAVQCADEAKSKPHPEMLHNLLSAFELGPEKALMIGDSIWDLRMASSAGVPAVAISHGASDADDLRKERPLAVVPHIEKLETLLFGECE